MNGKILSVLITVSFSFISNADAANKCIINNKTAYQDAPCPGNLGTVGDSIRAKEEEMAKPALEAKKTEERSQRDRKLNALHDPCGGLSFEERINRFRSDFPQHSQQIDKVLATSEAFVGMHESLIPVFLCQSILKTNVTTTAYGTTTQYVLKDLPVLPGKYIYTRNGVVSAIQK